MVGTNSFPHQKENEKEILETAAKTFPVLISHYLGLADQSQERQLKITLKLSAKKVNIAKAAQIFTTISTNTTKLPKLLLPTTALQHTSDAHDSSTFNRTHKSFRKFKNPLGQRVDVLVRVLPMTLENRFLALKEISEHSAPPCKLDTGRTKLIDVHDENLSSGRVASPVRVNSLLITIQLYLRS
jgi:hypothetical protein